MLSIFKDAWLAGIGRINIGNDFLKEWFQLLKDFSLISLALSGMNQWLSSCYNSYLCF